MRFEEANNQPPRCASKTASWFTRTSASLIRDFGHHPCFRDIDKLAGWHNYLRPELVASVAQLVEQQTLNLFVLGSTPSRGTIYSSTYASWIPATGFE